MVNLINSETVNTLKYAYRARKIQNKPVVNKMDLKALEMDTMRQKINQLEGRLKESSTNIPIQSDMIDFDNDQWMEYFMNQLKSRTIRGTNAIKALENVTTEKDSLAERLKLAEIEIEELKRIAGEQPNMAKELDTSFNVTVCKGLSPTISEQTAMAKIVKRYRPEEHLFDEEEEEEPTQAAESFLPPINLNESKVATSHPRRPPSSNSNNQARNSRRLSRRNTNNDDEVSMKPLEVELRETRKYVLQIEEELASTKTKLRQNEQLAEESSTEIDRLQRLG
jgi:hypothetical protein